ncbi:hydrogenase maturation protease [Sphaerospermopsis torques-reginae]|uniref:Hydrogenase maturation protease n=1 Tax=Sphaerospermopsis torques-reginae ITEP-024 TaxID=984208 RepID=A0ABX8X5T1_9CYAN|nr:hydrogenase maturation protease [Sphaerospermopsis torques-reginae]QYX34058.1 hydrogenase maturation protease [Sphaerospermopsis torques-reginae ITEP-024]
MMKKVIVIGYGNELRSDDGVGKKIADTIDSWNLSNVKSLAVHQLTPELADELANVNLSIFVDATINENMVVAPLSLTNDHYHSIGHFADPRSLLALTEFLYGKSPIAWLVTVPGQNFELGDRISLKAEKGITTALSKIMQILEQNNNLGITSE